MGLGYNSPVYYTYSDDVVVVYYDGDDLRTANITSVGDDENDSVIAIFDDGQIIGLCITENESGSAEKPENRNADVHLNFVESARVTIDGQTYTSDRTIELKAGTEYEMTVSFPDNSNAVVYENGTALPSYDGKYYFTANDEDNLIFGKVTAKSISVVDGADGFTKVTAPKAEQVLAANIILSDGQIGTYPAIEGVTYKWVIDGTDNVLGTDSRVTITSDLVGKKIKLTVTLNSDLKGDSDTLTWTSDAVVE